MQNFRSCRTAALAQFRKDHGKDLVLLVPTNKVAPSSGTRNYGCQLTEYVVLPVRDQHACIEQHQHERLAGTFRAATFESEHQMQSTLTKNVISPRGNATKVMRCFLPAVPLTLRRRVSFELPILHFKHWVLLFYGRELTTIWVRRHYNVYPFIYTNTSGIKRWEPSESRAGARAGPKGLTQA